MSRTGQRLAEPVADTSVLSGLLFEQEKRRARRLARMMSGDSSSAERSFAEVR